MNTTNLLKKLGKPLYVQVGFDGVWETALHLPMFTPLQAKDRAALYAYQGTDVAFEVFFEHPYGEAFVGIRPQIKAYEPLPVEQLVMALTHHPQLDLSVVAKLFSEYLGIAQPLFVGLPEHIEMGLVNLWNSFGQVILWHGKADAYSINHLASNDANRYLKPQEKPIGLEFAFANPHHWLAVPVSKQTQDGLHQLDLERLSQIFIALAEHS
ncbi:MAG: hypothetical protein HC878_06635 [Leptolyngbyaceae cyanobacterium SL_5_14]|nr:hypothetical protein [Leptolyngbyaceae cyanobacterium SL_5_14]